MRNAGRLIIISLAAACALAAIAVPTAATPARDTTCIGATCHATEVGYSVAESLVSTTATKATYNFTTTGPTDAAWTVFSGSSRIQGGTGLTGSFTVDLGMSYDLYAVGRAGGFSTGATVKHFSAPASSIPSTATPDSTPPVTTSDAQAVYYGPAVVTLSSTDALPGWGVAYVYYRVDGQATHMYRAPGFTSVSTSVTIPASEIGTHTVKFWSQDRAGNVEGVKTVSLEVRAKTKPSLGTPVAPATVYRTKYYTVYGSLKPRHAAGSKPVIIKCYKRNSAGAYKWHHDVYATASDYSSYSRYKASVKLHHAGKWRLRAYAPADTEHLSTWSSAYDYVTVK